MNPPQEKSNAQTIKVYNDVIDDVMQSVAQQWKKNGGNLQTLQKIEEIWRYRSLLACGEVTPEPKYIVRKAGQKANNENFDIDIFAEFSNTKQETEEEESNSDLTSGSELSESSEYSEEEDDDPEIDNLFKPIIPTDTLLCSYVNYPKDKKTKNSRITTLEVQNAHITTNGVPRVIKEGVLRIVH
ncbi:hypothetical protein GPJ56_006676 [Histomonas meleagridis]|uniref:uncharacterized protein n=1 Tax=Histomonas meleagridis TaxID=135588 RepID=UPI00355941BD|nr:hypothetical protein GPJ56_006676 [Histomonas meleagridis]KAH0805981.1 hypothetical protein GO595_001229 [Histomonas meleagridis]